MSDAEVSTGSKGAGKDRDWDPSTFAKSGKMLRTPTKSKDPPGLRPDATAQKSIHGGSREQLSKVGDGSVRSVRSGASGVFPTTETGAVGATGRRDGPLSGEARVRRESETLTRDDPGDVTVVDVEDIGAEEDEDEFSRLARLRPPDPEGTETRRSSRSETRSVGGEELRDQAEEVRVRKARLTEAKRQLTMFNNRNFSSEQKDLFPTLSLKALEDLEEKFLQKSRAVVNAVQACKEVCDTDAWAEKLKKDERDARILENGLERTLGPIKRKIQEAERRRMPEATDFRVHVSDVDVDGDAEDSDAELDTTVFGYRPDKEAWSIGTRPKEKIVAGSRAPEGGNPRKESVAERTKAVDEDRLTFLKRKIQTNIDEVTEVEFQEYHLLKGDVVVTGLQISPRGDASSNVGSDGGGKKQTYWQKKKAHQQAREAEKKAQSKVGLGTGKQTQQSSGPWERPGLHATTSEKIVASTDQERFTTKFMALAARAGWSETLTKYALPEYLRTGVLPPELAHHARVFDEIDFSEGGTARVKKTWATGLNPQAQNFVPPTSFLPKPNFPDVSIPPPKVNFPSAPSGPGPAGLVGSSEPLGSAGATFAATGGQSSSNPQGGSLGQPAGADGPPPGRGFSTPTGRGPPTYQSTAIGPTRETDGGRSGQPNQNSSQGASFRFGAGVGAVDRNESAIFGDHSHIDPNIAQPSPYDSLRHFDDRQRRGKSRIVAEKPYFDGTKKSDWNEFKSLFAIYVGNENLPDYHKLVDLKSCLGGKALMQFKGCVGTNYEGRDKLKQVLDMFEEAYGGPHNAIQKFLFDMSRCPILVEFDHDSLLLLKNKVRDVLETFERYSPGSMETELSVINSLLRILPQKEYEKFTEYLHVERRRVTVKSLFDFLQFRYSSVRSWDAMMTNLGVSARPQSRSNFTKQRGDMTEFEIYWTSVDAEGQGDEGDRIPLRSPPAHVVNTVDGGFATRRAEPSNAQDTVKRSADEKDPQNAVRFAKCSFCDDESHAIWRCDAFKELPTLKRFEAVKKRRLCYHCLSPGHTVKACQKLKNKTCGVEGCQRYHNSLLHNFASLAFEEYYIQEQAIAAWENPEESEDRSMFFTSANTFWNPDEEAKIPVPSSIDEIAIRTVVADMKVGEKRKRVLVALDSCSNSTNIDQGLAEEMGCSVLRSNVMREISFMDRDVKIDSQIVEFELIPVGHTSGFRIEAYTVEGLLPGGRQTDWKKTAQVYKHLRDVEPFPETLDEKCKILLGTDYAGLMFPMSTKFDKTDPKAPIAERTRLGWAFSGRTGVSFPLRRKESTGFAVSKIFMNVVSSAVEEKESTATLLGAGSSFEKSCRKDSVSPKDVAKDALISPNVAEVVVQGLYDPKFPKFAKPKKLLLERFCQGLEESKVCKDEGNDGSVSKLEIVGSVEDHTGLEGATMLYAKDETVVEFGNSILEDSGYEEPP